jgi:hypothetical protein
MQNWLLELQVATLVLLSKYEVVNNMSKKLSNYNMYEKGMRRGGRSEEIGLKVLNFPQ